MNEYCRLCFTNTSVNNDIFNRDNYLYVKMTSCLPFKISDNDRLPHKICDDCNNKLENFYEFCTMAIDVQNRLISVCGIDEEMKTNIGLTAKVEFEPKVFQNLEALEHAEANSKYTQTDELVTIEMPIKPAHQLKQEVLDEKYSVETNEEAPVPHKIEALSDDGDHEYMDAPARSDSDEVSLFEMKKQKRKRKSKKAKIKSVRKNKGVKRPRKDKAELPDSVSILEADIKQENPETGLDSAMVEIEIKKRLSECSDDENFYSIDRLGNGDIFDTGNQEPYYCCICYLQSRNRFEMLAHYRAHLKNPSANPLTISGDNSGAYKCWLCGQEFPRRTNFDKHLLSDHDIKRPYKCSLCEMTFREATQILKHSQTHSYNRPNAAQPQCGIPDCPNALAAKPCPEHATLTPAAPEPVSKRFMCDTCDETFVYMRYMMEHRKRQHPEVCAKKPVHRCMHCKREFAHLNSLRRHLRMHTGERNYLCNVCGKALSSPEHLKFHIRIHNGIKPHACKTCGKAFVKKCNLKLHERVHSGERPHVCSHCGKGFSQRSTLVIHERYHSGARPYVCELCNKGFVARGLLSMHLKATCRIERI